MFVAMPIHLPIFAGKTVVVVAELVLLDVNVVSTALIMGDVAGDEIVDEDDDGRRGL